MAGSVVQNDFPKLTASLVARLELAVEATAQNVRTDAASRPQPASIAGQWTIDRRGSQGQGRITRFVANRDWRAVFTEDGTPFRAAQPMLRPALESQARGFEQRLEWAMSRV